MFGADGINYLRQVTLEMRTLRHEDRRHRYAFMAGLDELGHRLFERRFHDLEKSEFDRGLRGQFGL
jgi:hypothetical protein